jgi:hypothetical protein
MRKANEMKRIQLARAALVVGLVWAVGACDSLTEVNENPNQPTDVPAGLLLPQAIQNAVQNAMGGSQFMSHSMIWPQQGVELQYPDEEEGIVRQDRMEGYWAGYYQGSLMDIQTVIDKGVEAEDDNIEAVGLIWKSWIFHIVTDYYGDVPYSEALQGAENTIPAYDTQQQIYAGMLADLTTAAGMLASPSGTDFGDGDLLYDNDFELWRRFANSLRMRLAMRLSEVDPVTAEAEFVAAYNAGGFQSNADNAMLRYPGAPYENPLYENRVNQARDDHGISRTMVDTLLSLNDPRLPLYAEPAQQDLPAIVYRGHENGRLDLPPGQSLAWFSRIGDFWRFDGAATPSMVMTYSEVLSLQAEAAFRTWIAADPATLYTEAIQASMDQYDEWGVGPSDADIATYLAQPAVVYNGTLERIILQKWIALWMVGPEAWSDWRRTDLPALTPGPDLILAYIPVRFTYPDSEQSLNSANLDVAVARQGGFSLTDRVWWDVSYPP